MKDRVLGRLFLRYRERGDGRALAAVFDGTARELLGVAVHLCRGAGEAEDVVQATFVRAIERAATYDPAHELRGWLYGILVREAATLRRKRARIASGEPPDEPEACVEPLEALASEEVPGLVRAAIEELPARYRAVLAPLLIEERTPSEIAASLGRAPGTVRGQIQRGLERLRQKLPRELATFGLIGTTRGLGRVRTEVLAKAGTLEAPGALASAGLVAWTAFAATPLLWPLPLAASAGALVLAAPGLFVAGPSGPEPAPLALSTKPGTTEEDPMKTALLVPLVALPVPAAQDAREEVRTETVVDKVAALDALVGELLVLSEPGEAEADVAWSALLHAKQRIEEDLRRRRSAEEQASTSLSQVEAWKQAIRQIEDVGRRDQALDEILEALATGAPDAQLAACQALTACGEVEFDRSPFRPLLLPLATSASGKLHVAALYALFNLGALPEDRALALALADEPSEEAVTSGPHLAALFCELDLRGDAGAAVTRMFENASPQQRREMLSGIWGAQVSPELEALMLELSRSGDSSERFEVMYFTLSTFDPKSEAVVRRLIEYVPSTNWQQASRALWGLSCGVGAEEAPLVVDAAQALFAARGDAAIQIECLGLVGRYAGREDEAWLADIAEDARRPRSVRDAAAEALAAARER